MLQLVSMRSGTLCASVLLALLGLVSARGVDAQVPPLYRVHAFYYLWYVTM